MKKVLHLILLLTALTGVDAFSADAVNLPKVMDIWKNYLEAIRTSSVQYSVETDFNVVANGNLPRKVVRQIVISNSGDKTKILIDPHIGDGDTERYAYLYDGKKYLIMRNDSLGFSHDLNKLNFQPMQFNPLLIPFATALIASDGTLNPAKLYDPYFWSELAKTSSIKTTGTQYVISCSGTLASKQARMASEIWVDQQTFLPSELKIKGENGYSSDTTISYVSVDGFTFPNMIDQKDLNEKGEQVNHIIYQYLPNTFTKVAVVDDKFWTLPVGLAKSVYDLDRGITLKNDAFIRKK